MIGRFVVNLILESIEAECSMQRIFVYIPDTLIPYSKLLLHQGRDLSLWLFHLRRRLKQQVRQINRSKSC